jgi:hypothetical protein
MTRLWSPALPRYAAGFLGLVFSLIAPGAVASEFALAVSPPRFELEVKPGERLRQIMEITNASSASTTFSIRTADWLLGMDNSVTFSDELRPGSCRPWVAIERRELTIAGGRPYRFRFEVNVPPDAKPGECRFAIMLEGQEQVTRMESGPPIPFSARLGVVVYVTIGGATPELSVAGSGVQTVNGKPTPVLQIRNSGTAHGRITGFLNGTDASNTSLEFSPANTPILPGETRTIPLSATRPGDQDTAAQIRYPVTVRGKLEWGKGQTQSIEQRFAP